MSYIVASPGRTGSVFLSQYLKMYLMQQHNKWFYVYTIQFYHNDMEPLPTNFIVHCHNAKMIPSNLPAKQLIITTRNLIDIAASWQIANLTNVFHFGNFSDSKQDIGEYISKYKNVTYKVPVKDFLSQIKKAFEFYQFAYNFYQNAIIFNYDETINIESINQKLGLCTIDVSNIALPVAQPLDKWKIIENKDEILRAGNQAITHYKKLYPEIFEKFNLG